MWTAWKKKKENQKADTAESREISWAKVLRKKMAGQAVPCNFKIPERALVWAPAALLLIKLHANMPRKTYDPCTWISISHMEDQDGIPSSWLQPDLDLDV